VSGNPKGRPVGARDKVSAEVEALLGQHSTEVAARLIKRARSRTAT
jgi:hypothetical protein